MSRDYFVKCCVCERPLIHYGEIREIEFRSVLTDREIYLACKSCDTTNFIESQTRVRCEEINKDGIQCRYDANNVKPHKCAKHGGEYK
jgi:hypothetical protein